MEWITANGTDPAQIEWVRDHGMVPEDISVSDPIGVDDQGRMYFTRFMRNEHGKYYTLGDGTPGRMNCVMATETVVVTPTRPFPV